MAKVEYRVRHITRYIVTRYEDGGDGKGSSSQHGVFDSGDMAYQVAYALCAHEHAKSGDPVGSDNYIYPNTPEGVTI